MNINAMHTQRSRAWVVGGVASLIMAVSAFGQYVGNGGGITINDNANASPYPSSINLTTSGILGVVERVTVTVKGLTHPYAPDLGFLLVGPNGKAVILMANAGGNPTNGSAVLNGVTLTFSDLGSSMAYNDLLVDGGTYKPQAFNLTSIGGPPVPPALAAAATDTTLAAAFARGANTNLNPNGVWSLYVLDSQVGPPTSLSPAIGSWTLNLNTRPTLTVPATTQTAPVLVSEASTAGATSVTVGVTVNSSSTPVGSLRVNGYCADANLVKNADITATTPDGAGNVTVTLKPNANAYGTNTVAIVCNDGVGAVTNTIWVGVAHVNQKPTLSLSSSSLSCRAGIMSGSSVSGGSEGVIIRVAVDDPDRAPANTGSGAVTLPNSTYGDLSLTVISTTDPDVVPLSGVVLSTNTTMSVGSPSQPNTPTGISRTVTVIPGTKVGTATVTLALDDTKTQTANATWGGASLTNTATFTVTTTAPTHNGNSITMFANTNSITAAAGAFTNSTITVPAGALAGLVANVQVNLNRALNFGDNNPTVGLTAPNGASVTLLGSYSSGSKFFIGQIQFTNSASGTLTGNSLTNVVKLPPVTPSIALSGGTNNGTWTLWVTNTSGADSQILDGWSLFIYPQPTISPAIADVSINMDTSTSFTFTPTSRHGTPVYPVQPTILGDPTVATITTNVSSSKVYTYTIQGNANKFGTNTVQVFAVDNQGYTNITTFQLAQRWFNHAPVVSFIGRQDVHAGAVLGPIPFTVSDVDIFTPVSSPNFVVTAVSDSQKLIPDSNILLQQLGPGSYQITLFPMGTVSATNYITITATDGGTPPLANALTDTNVFAVYVQDPGYPNFAVPDPIAINNSSPAVPYPSTNMVSGLYGMVSNVTVTLFGLSHPVPGNMQAVLVGPKGQNVLLMQNAGDANSVTNVVLVFSGSGTPLPSSAQIISGIYQPTGYPTLTSLPGTAPAGPYGTSLSTFYNTDPNGPWRLYLADNGSVKGGILNFGWQLSIQTMPSIQPQPIKDQFTDETTDEINKSLSLQVVLGDVQPALNYTLTATPGDPNLIKPIGVSISGNVATLAITPQPYRWGTNTILLSDSDGMNISNITFNIGVRFVPQPPRFVTFPGNQAIAAGTPLGPLTFKVWAPVGPVWAPPNNPVTVTASADQPGLVPSVSVIQQGSSPDLTNTYSLTLIPTKVQKGQTTITVTATDNTGLKSSRSFVLTVADNLAFVNPDPSSISIPSGLFPQGPYVSGTAVPYPSVINVKGKGGLVRGVQVALLGFTHGYPSDVDVLLVSPDNTRSVMLMAHAGNAGSAAASAVGGLRLTFDDSASDAIPGSVKLTNGTYKPADYSGGVYGPAGSNLPAPAPTAPGGGYRTILNSTFDGLDPNGDWKLFVLDDQYPDGGSLDGWILYLQTGPAFAPIATQTVNENATRILPITVSDASVSDLTKINVVPSYSGASPPGLWSALVVSTVAADGTAFVTMTPVANRPSALINTNGTSQVSLTATDPNGRSTTTTFGFVVNYVNQFPEVQSLGLGSTPTNAVYVNETASPGTFTLNYSLVDADSIFGLSNIVVTSSDQNLVKDTKVVRLGNNWDTLPAIGGTLGMSGTVNVNVTPWAPTAPGVGWGTNTIIFVVKDLSNNWVTNFLTFGVIHVWQAPAIFGADGVNPIPSPQACVAGNTTTNIAIVVKSVEVSTKNLSVSATSDNSAVVPNSPANIILSGSGDNRTLTLRPIGTPTSSQFATITVSVTDGTATTSTTFLFRQDPAPVNVFANTNAIVVSGNTPAGLYPSTIAVTGLTNKTFRVSAVLNGLSHTVPADLDVLLVQTNRFGTNAVMLMSGAGGANTVNNLNLAFDDSGVPLPNDPSVTLTSGTYQPGNYTKSTLPAPAPTVTYQAALSAFNGLDPNGTWNLFVNNRGGSSGQIASGWTLLIQTTPIIVSPTASLTMSGNTTATVNLRVVDTSPSPIVPDPTKLNVKLTADDNSDLLPSRGVGIPLTPDSAGNVLVTLTPELTRFGTANLIFTVYNSAGASSSVPLQVIVQKVNLPPDIARINDQAMDENTTKDVAVLVTDQDTPLPLLSIKAEADPPNPALLSSTSLQFYPYGTNQLIGLPGTNIPQTSVLALRVTPIPFQFGTANIKITVTDNGLPAPNVVISNFLLTVSQFFYPPIMDPVGPYSVAAGGTLTVPFKVYSPVTAATTLTVVAQSSDGTLATVSAPFSTDASGTNRAVTITAVGNTTGGTATITLTVTDPSPGNGKAAQRAFPLTVLPSRARTVANNKAILIPQQGVASLYPSQIPVSGFVGPITKVSVTVSNFTHHFPSDVGILLVQETTGRSIVLMNNAGVGSPATNATLIFDQSASAFIPQAAFGVNPPPTAYKPKDYKVPTGYSFPPLAPAGTYTNLTLDAAFNSQSPNGTWSLYVWDQAPPDDGVISDGWSLAITTLPVINGLADISADMNNPATGLFTVGDDTPSTPSYQFDSITSSTAVVDPSKGGVVFSASGSKVTVTVTPVANTFGTTTIGFRMINQDGQTVNASFKATFNQVFYPPFIDPIPPQTTTVGSVALVPINYGNQGLSQNQLTLSYSSSDLNLVPLSSIKLIGNKLQVAPADSLTGTSTITVFVTNPHGDVAKTSFDLTVIQGFPPVFGNSGAIAIVDNNPAQPYPSTVNVSGVPGTIAKVTVTLSGFWHTFPSDVSLLLVGPQGQKVVLMSRAGGSTSIPSANAVRLTFDDATTNSVPQFTAITDGTYHVTDYKPSDTFRTDGIPGPQPPAPPYSHTLSAFNGSDPNGTWLLYAQDDVAGDSGAIAGGWQLTITPSGGPSGPTISQPLPQTTPENQTKKVLFTVGSLTTPANNLIVTATHSGDNPPGLVSSLVVDSSDPTNRVLLITPGANLPSAVTTNNGTSTITLAVSDGSVTNTKSFTLTVLWGNQGPVMSLIADTNTLGNVAAKVPFTINDPDKPVSGLDLSASSSNPGLVSGVTFDRSGDSNIVATVNLVANTIGVAQLTFTVSDGSLSNSQPFNLTVNTPVSPTLAPIGPQTTAMNKPLAVPLSVTVGGTPLNALIFSSAVSDKSLVPSITFSNNGTIVVAMVNVGTNQSGTATITIAVNDGFTTVAQFFKLTVNPNAPVLDPIADQTTKANTPVSVTLGITSPATAISNLLFTGTSSDPGLVKSVTFNNNGTKVVATVNPVANAVGQASVTITMNDGFTPVSTSFNLTVNPPTPPSLAAISDQTTPMNKSIQVALNVTSPDTAIKNLSIAGSAADKSLVPSVVIPNNGTNPLVATVNVGTNQSGSTTIVISVNDGFTTIAQFFKLTVAPTPPSLGAIADQTTKANVPASVTLNVTSPATPISQLVFTGASSNPGLVKNVTINNNGVTVVATVNLVTNQTGQATVTITMGDGFTTVTNSFKLTVNPPTPPTLAAIADQRTPLNTAAQVTLKVASTDTPIKNLVFSALASDTTLVPSATFFNDGTNVVATLNVAANLAGSATIVVSANDGFTTVNQFFTLTVTAAAPGKLTISLAGSAVAIKFTGTPGGAYTVQSTGDLKNWTDAGTVTAASNGAAQFNATIPGAGAQFYRAHAK